jgi:iron complex outermembrane receptor protein
VPRTPIGLRPVAAALALGAAAAGHAQTTENPPRLAPVVVQADAEKSLTVPSIEQAERNIRRVPGGAEVVDPKTYETGRSSNLSDALSFATGVFVQPRFGADEARISIRGSGIQRTFHGRGIILLQDGVPLNLADGSFDMQAVEPLGMQYIEVFRGANALQYGSTTLGGAINFVAPTGYTSDLLRLRGELGSFKYYKGFASTGGVQGNFDYNVSGSYQAQDGYRDWAEQQNARFFTNFGWRINADLETRFYLTALDSDSQLPGSITKAQAATDPRLANAANLAGRQKRDFPLYRIANKTAYRLGDGVLEAAAFYSYKDLWHPIFQVIDQVSNDYGISLRYVTEAPLAGRQNRFVAGIIPQWGTVNDNRFVNVQGAAGARTGQSWQNSANYVLYAEDQFFFTPQWAGVLGAQATRAQRKLDDRFLVDGNQSVNQTYQHVSPKIGVLYRPTPAIDAFANLSGSYEPPTFGELTGGPNVTPLSAQTGRTFEIGTRGFLPAVQWDIAYYYTKVDDELLSLNSLTGQPLGTVNAPNTVHQGIEFGLVWTIVDQLVWRSSYLWNDFRFSNNPVYGDNRLPGIPPQFLRAELLYQPPGGWYFGPTTEWSIKNTPVDMANTIYADSYWIWGLKGGRQVAKGLSFFIEGRNLGNKHYVATTGVIANARGLDQPQFWPGDGRAVYVGLEWRM